MKLKKSTYGWSAIAILFLISSLGQVFGKPTPGETNHSGTTGASFALTLLFIFLAYRSTLKNKDKPKGESNNRGTPYTMNTVTLENPDYTGRPDPVSIKVEDENVNNSVGKLERKKISLVEQEEARNRTFQVEATIAAPPQSKDLCPICHEPRLRTDVAYCSKCGGKLN